MVCVVPVSSNSAWRRTRLRWLAQSPQWPKDRGQVSIHSNRGRRNDSSFL